jgi:hypothetical protein
MNLEVVHSIKEPINAQIPSKSGHPSGYYLIAMVRSYIGHSVTVDRYVCFTNYTKDQVWIEKLAITRPRKWFAFDDTVKIEDDEEFNEVHNFLINKGVLGATKRN